MGTPSADLAEAIRCRLPYGRRLTASERLRLAAEIVGAYVRVRRVLRGAQIADVVAQLRDRPLAGARGMAVVTATPDEARRLGRAVTRTLALVPGDTRCLARSLVLIRLLARRGISSTLVIGARPAPSFLAHAWVECAGAPVLSPGDGSFSRLVEL